MGLFKKIIVIASVLLVALSILTIYYSSIKTPNMIYGVTFNWEFAKFLGLDYRKVFLTIMDDWQFKHIRIPVQWETVEPTPGNYNWKELDWIMSEAEKRKVKIILAVGQKTPRWPECHIPDWAQKLTGETYGSALKNYIGEVVKHSEKKPALEIWQVENEPFLSFGGCRTFTDEMLENEINLVKKLDTNHPTLVSDSGELSTWFRTARAADLFGTTMYRVVWNKYFGYWNYDWLPPFHYRLKMWLNGSGISRAYIMELQAEPWLERNNFLNADMVEQNKTMNLDRLKKNLDYAERVGMPRVYLWGAEWWYFLREKGEVEISNFIKEMKKD